MKNHSLTYQNQPSYNDRMDASSIFPPFILSLDVGSSSLRAVLFDRVGQVVKRVSLPFTIPTRPDGAAEVDVEDLLLLLWKCVDQALDETIKLTQDIVGVALCTFASSILGVGVDGRPFTPLITYADTRAIRESQALRDQLDEEAIHQRTGCHFHTSYWPANLLWFAREHPEQFRKARYWMSLGDYLGFRLFGERKISLCAASWTGLLNRHLLSWDEELLQSLSIEVDQLSELVDVDKPFRGLIPEFAQRWSALNHIAWFPGLADGAAANLGSGCISPNELAVTMGTTTAVRVVKTESPYTIPQGLWCYRVDRNRSLLGGALSEGGGLFAWITQLLGQEIGPDLEAALAAQTPDSSGLTFLPLIFGERSPGWAAQARGALTGLSKNTTSVEIVQASMESIAYRIALIFRLLAPELGGNVQVIGSGGALTGSPTWLQILADVLGRPVKASLVTEPSARGAALLALEALHLLDDLKQISGNFGREFHPDPKNYYIYQAALERQDQLYQILVQAN